MKIHDISQELFSCEVFPGDPAPEKKTVLSMENGDKCNLTSLSMCAHNGTHVDAPYHFYRDGRTIDELALEKVVGMAQVISFDGELSDADIKRLLAPGTKRVLFRGQKSSSGRGSGWWAWNPRPSVQRTVRRRFILRCLSRRSCF